MKFLFLLILLFSANAYGWYNKPELGLGYTSNANYEESREDSDFYLWLRSYIETSFNDKDKVNFWISYKDHFEESQYDALHWRTGFTTPTYISKRSWLLDFAIGGQHYTSTNPETTEEGFDYLYSNLAGIKTYHLKSNIEGTIEPGYQLKVFTDLGSRIDHRIYFNGLLDISIDSRQKASPYAEIGMVFSNESLFRKNYLELGTGWTYLMRSDFKLGADFMVRVTSYINRTVSTDTPISLKRNRSKSAYESQNEVHNYSQLEGYIVKMYKSFNLKGSLNVANQNSKSGFEDYSEYGAKISAIFNF